jgi:carbonic anhydrase
MGIARQSKAYIVACSLLGVAILAAFLGVLLADKPSLDHQVSAQNALRRLKQGNARYVAHRLKHPDQSAHRMHEIEEGQHPFATVLGCSDSRVPPEIIFDEGLGDLFVIRVAGAVPGDEVIGSIEYAVEHLHTSLVVVLGHGSCGAVTAAVNGPLEQNHTKSFVEVLLPFVNEARQMPGDPIQNAMCLGVDAFAWALRRSEPVLAAEVAKANVRIVAAHYDMHTGEVVWHREALD